MTEPDEDLTGYYAPDPPINCMLPATPEPPQDSREKTIREHTISLHLIGEQLSQIESWFWQHLADVREAERTTANNPPTSGDAANNPLREQYAAIIRSECGSRFEYVTAQLLAVHQRDTAQLRAERDMALTAATEARAVVDQVRAALTGEFMAGPKAVMVVRVDTVREALKTKEAP